jgi:hypothetical protein
MVITNVDKVNISASTSSSFFDPAISVFESKPLLEDTVNKPVPWWCFDFLFEYVSFICLSFGQEACSKHVDTTEAMYQLKKNNNFGIDTLKQTEQLYSSREYAPPMDQINSNVPFEYLNDDENAEINIQPNPSARIDKTENFELKSPRRFLQSPETVKALERNALPRSMKRLFTTMKRDTLQSNRSEDILHHSLPGGKTWIGQMFAGQQLSSDCEINCKRKWSGNGLKPKKRNWHDPTSYISIENSRLEQMLQPKQTPLLLEIVQQVSNYSTAFLFIRFRFLSHFVILFRQGGGKHDFYRIEEFYRKVIYLAQMLK